MSEKDYYLDFNGLKEAYENHLRTKRHYKDNNLYMAMIDFYDPYTYKLCESSYVDDVQIDGENYEKFAYWIDFIRHFGSMTQQCYYRGMDKEELNFLKDMDTPFCLYVYFKLGKGSHSTTDYKNAERLYEVEEEDFYDFDFTPVGRFGDEDESNEDEDDEECFFI